MVKLQAVALALCAGSAAAGQTRYFRRGGASPDLPLDHPALRHSTFIEQVHVTGGHPDSAVITWLTNASSTSQVQVCKDSGKTSLSSRSSSDCQTFKPHNEAFSFLLDPPSYYPGESPCQGSSNYTNPDCYYTSGVIHSAYIREFLEPGEKYTYTFEDDDDNLSFGFKMPPAVDPDAPITFAVVGDLGQTGNSSQTVDGLYAKAVDGKEVDLILFAGDLAYADGFAPRWDSYARMGQKLWANTITSYTGGNHEFSNSGENWQNYHMRYPNDFELSGSDSFLWYSYSTASVHVISLCSYAAFDENSLQYQWLKQDLAQINRTETPWVVAMWHTPWYTSNAHHPRSEGAEMMAAMEDLIHGQVDIVFNGHVHAYERSVPVYHDKPTPASEGGVTYITIGDGGNREEFAVPWVDPQPDWSAVREFAYGFGELEVMNSTTATWRWLRNDEPGFIGDEYVFRKK